MAITDLEIRMTIKTLAAKGVPKRAIARQLDLSEGTVRCHLARQAAGARDGRADQPRRASAAADAIAHWMAHHDRTNLAALHAWLVAEHGYTGSLRAVQRFVADRYPPPPVRARRRVETPQISCRGDSYLRTLLIQGARSSLQRAKATAADKATPEQIWIRDLASRLPFGKVLVAIANKHARQLWAMLARDEDYDADAWLRHPMVQRPASGRRKYAAA